MIPLPGGVGRDEEAGAGGIAEALHGLLAFGPGHAAVDRGHPARVPQRLQPPDEIVCGVAVLAEHEPLLLRVLGVLQQLAEPLELRLPSRVDEMVRAVPEIAQRLDFLPQLLDRDRDDRPEHRVLVVLVALSPPVIVLVVGRVEFLEEIRPERPVEARLAAAESGRVDAPGFEIGDQRLDLADTALQRCEQRPRRTGQPSLEHAHGELDGLPVFHGPAVRAAQILRGAVVQRPLAVGSLREVVTERVAAAVAEDGLTVEIEHLLLGAANEVSRAILGWEAAPRLFRSEHPVVQQPPQVMVRRILAHVGRGRQEQEMMRRPLEARPVGLRRAAFVSVPLPGARRPGRTPRQRLGELVALGLAGSRSFAGGAQLVRFVEDHEVVGCSARIGQPGESGAPAKRV